MLTGNKGQITVCFYGIVIKKGCNILLATGTCTLPHFFNVLIYQIIIVSQSLRSALCRVSPANIITTSLPSTTLHCTVGKLVTGTIYFISFSKWAGCYSVRYCQCFKDHKDLKKKSFLCVFCLQNAQLKENTKLKI